MPSDLKYKLILKGKRNLLPIASIFDGLIPEEDLEFEYDHSSKILNPYAAWDVMRKQFD